MRSPEPRHAGCAIEQIRALAARRLAVSRRVSPFPESSGCLSTPSLAARCSIEGRNRLALEIAAATVKAIGRDRVGMRLSPYGIFNSTGEFPEVQAPYLALVASLSKLGLLYLHLVDHASMGTPPLPAKVKLALRAAFDGLFILSGGFDHASAEQALLDKRGDLIAFGRPFLANPDLLARMQEGAPLNAPDQATFYSPGAKGYTDYPVLAA